jgi:hypothetical protein
MAKFQDHIAQAKSNLKFLETTNRSANNYWDWQVTVAFYVGVHLVNSHLVKKLGFSFYSHNDTLNSINFTATLSPAKMSEREYLAYRKLYNLSRRSRYLCMDADKVKTKSDPEIAYITYSKHLEKAINHLEVILKFTKENYSESFDKVELDLIEIKNKSYDFFMYKKT